MISSTETIYDYLSTIKDKNKIATPDNTHKIISNYRLAYKNAIDKGESEEHFKNMFIGFLKNLCDYDANTKDRIDLIIEKDDIIKVIVEAKSPFNKGEMLKATDFVSKSFCQALYYFDKYHDYAINKIIITNFDDIYLFSSKDFNTIRQDKSINSLLEEYKKGSLEQVRTNDVLYNVLKDLLTKTNFEIKATKFSLLDNKLDVELIYQALSSYSLFNETVHNDNNELNIPFYNELLHVLGLKETEDTPTKLVKSETKNSLIDLTMQMLKDKDFSSDNEVLYERALSLNILWINRILFLKLLESYLRVARDDNSFAILSGNKIITFSELDRLFFRVLNKSHSDRDDQDNADKVYRLLPYLNSSLFTMVVEEKDYGIDRLYNNRTIEIYEKSIITGGSNKLNTLDYLLQFLNCYQFNKAQSDIDDKTIIKTSVLGLIFEKLNGHKDGAHFTPSSITMYMSKEVLRGMVVRKFNKVFALEAKSYNDLKKYIKDHLDDSKLIEKACHVLDSITVIDPAVGSGHFLVSVLNELIFIRCDLGLFDSDIDFKVTIINDELHIKRQRNDEYFVYKVENGFISEERDRVQKYLFSLTRQIIQNQLYGLDINADSVNICRLRLWIELLKRSYFTNDKLVDLEVLPNLEFKVFAANSLVPLSIANMSLYFNKSHQEHLHKEMAKYFNSNKEDKKSIQQEIIAFLDKQKEILHPISTLLDNYNPFDMTFTKVYNFFDSSLMFGLDKFDVVIANPPYIQLQTATDDGKKLGDLYADKEYKTFEKKGDIYALFYELASLLTSDGGMVGFITSNKWMRADYGKSLRRFLSQKNCLQLIDLGSNVFDSATVDTNILIYANESVSKQKIKALSLVGMDKDLSELTESDFIEIDGMNSEAWLILNHAEKELKNKIESKGLALKRWDIKINYGIKTGYNEAFIIDKVKYDQLVAIDSNSKEILKPLLKDDDITKYNISWSGLYLILTHNGYKGKPRIEIDGYPAVKEHIDSIIHLVDSGIIKRRGGHTGNNKHFFERTDKGKTPYNHRSCTYIESFYKPKIVFKQTSTEQTFTYDDNKYVLDVTAQMIYSNDNNSTKYLLGLLNSSVSNFYLRETCSSFGEKGTRWIPLYIKNLPIPVPTHSQKESIVQLVDQVLSAKKHGLATAHLEDQIDQIVYQLYDLSETEITIVDIKPK